jgi:hypothetical protein
MGPSAGTPAATGAAAWLRTRRGQVFVAVPVAVALVVVIAVLALVPRGSPPKPTVTGAATRSPVAVRTPTKPTPTTTPTSTPTPKPLPVGDACLVGTWQSHGIQEDTTFRGATVLMTGASGNVDHITAAGTDTDVYGPGTLPLYGTYEGSTLQQDWQGEDVLSMHGNPRTHVMTLVDHGWTAGSTNKYVYQGANVGGQFDKPDSTPSNGPYTCTATTLTTYYKGKPFEVETRLSTKP